jgi:hypothetical protein
MSAQDEPQLTAKDQLELTKLKLEIRTFNRTFYAQIANTVCILILGLAVLMFYQWPQLQQMEDAQELQVYKLVEDTQANIKDPGDKTRMLDAIARRYPKYSFVIDIATAQHSGEQVAASEMPKATSGGSLTSRLPDKDRRVECETLKEKLAALDDSITKLTVDLDYEEKGAGTTGKPGRGRAFRALLDQLASARNQLRAGEANYHDHCSSL